MTDRLMDGNVPEFDISDRLRKALRYAGVSVQEMAEELGMSRNSPGNYLNGRGVPDKRTLMVWALKTGVSYEWLATGKAQMRGPDGDGGLPRLDSNQEPADYEYALLTPQFAGQPVTLVA
jgi:transcriptional regulator with XRE-family HTH domain